MDLIEQIKGQRLAPHSMSKRERRACVAYLTREGLSAAEVAKVLKMSDRTVSRYREKIRRSEALKSDPNFSAELAGTIYQALLQSTDRLRRYGRDKDASVSERIEAERVLIVSLDRISARLQTMGYATLVAAAEARRDAPVPGTGPAWQQSAGSSAEARVAELQRLQAIAEADWPHLVQKVVSANQQEGGAHGRQ